VETAILDKDQYLVSFAKPHKQHSAGIREADRCPDRPFCACLAAKAPIGQNSRRIAG
jgi:hypothetical protein